MRVRLFAVCLVTSIAIAFAGSAHSTPATAGVRAGRTVIALPDTVEYSAAERTILALERERSAAIARLDTTWLATLYAPDFEAIVGNGRRIRRADLFEIFGRDDPRSQFQIDELAVRAYAGAATVTGRLKFLDRDGVVVAETRYTHVYVQRNGHWWMVRAQATAVPKAPSAPSPPAK